MNNLNIIKIMERTVRFYDWYKSLGGNVALLNVEELEKRLSVGQKKIKRNNLKGSNYIFKIKL